MSQLLSRPLIKIPSILSAKFVLPGHGINLGIPTGYDIWKGSLSGLGISGQPIFDIRFSSISTVDLSNLIDGYTGSEIRPGLTQISRREELDRYNMILPDHRLALALVNQLDQVYLECLYQRTGVTKIFFYGSIYQKNNRSYCLCVLRNDLGEKLKWSMYMMPTYTFVTEDDVAFCFEPSGL